MRRPRRSAAGTVVASRRWRAGDGRWIDANPRGTGPPRRMNPGAHLFWITSRAAGFTALITASVSVGVGIASLPRPAIALGPRTDMRRLHEALGLTTLVAIALHGLALLGDGYLHPGLAGIAVPFVGPYRPAWTALGIIGGYGLAVLGLAYYARARIG